MQRAQLPAPSSLDLDATIPDPTITAYFTCDKLEAAATQRPPTPREVSVVLSPGRRAAVDLSICSVLNPGWRGHAARTWYWLAEKGAALVDRLVALLGVLALRVRRLVQGLRPRMRFRRPRQDDLDVLRRMGAKLAQIKEPAGVRVAEVDGRVIGVFFDLRRKTGPS
jgi:hypothetical protein